MEIRRISSMLRARLFNRRSVQTRKARQRARLMATFKRFREKRNSALRGMCSDDEVVMVKKTTAASRPWNLSTVPTETPRVAASASSVWRSSATWSL